MGVGYPHIFLYITFMSKLENTLWVEKYRPKDLESFVGNENLKTTLSKYLSQNDIQNFIFYGPAGCGKTTLAKILVNHLKCDSLYINASDENGIDTIRNKVRGFASMASINNLKIVILDEADFITINGQSALRNIIETFSTTTRFILTCNYVERIIDPLQSRCQVVKVVPPSKYDIALHLSKILKKENVEFLNIDIAHVVNKQYPDLRKMINIFQSSLSDNKLVLDNSFITSNNYINKIIEELKTKNPNFNKIRQIVVDSNIDDYTESYKMLYERANEYLPGKEGLVAILVTDHTYKQNFRIDKEICFMSLISNLINNK